MARNEPKLDAETAKAMEAMRAEEPIEEIAAENTETIEEKVETKTDDSENKDTSKVSKEVKKDIKSSAETETKTVPLAALHETREELKAEKKRNEEERRKTDERLRLLTEVLTAKPATQDTKDFTPPDPEKDALGTLKLNQTQIKELIDYKKNQEAEQQRNVQRQTTMTEAARLERDFMVQAPDYSEASNFLVQSRGRELEATGMYNIAQINEILRNESYALAVQAIQQGRNPAETVYAIAKARGYTMKAKEADKIVKTETESEKLDRILEGQESSKSLGQAQGAQASNGKLDSKTLANMSEEEFQKLYSKLSRGERMALMGN